jgi:hypothetical protein
MSNFEQNLLNSNKPEQQSQIILLLFAEFEKKKKMKMYQ